MGITKPIIAAFLVASTFAQFASAETIRVLKSYPAYNKVLIDQGSSNGFTPGTKVGFHSQSGAKGWATVTQANASRAYLEVPAEAAPILRDNELMSYRIQQTTMAKASSSRSPASALSGSFYTRSASKTSLRGMVGMANAGLQSGVMVFGADLVFPVGEHIKFSPGITYWGLSSGASAAGSVDDVSSANFMVVDAGLGYEFPLNRNMSLEMGGRAGFFRSAYTFSSSALTSTGYSSATVEDSEESISGLLLSPYALLDYKLGDRASIGGEIRLPYAATGLGGSLMYFMGFVQYRL